MSRTLSRLLVHAADALVSRDVPATLPADPSDMVELWMDDAKRCRKYLDPWAMVVATSTPCGCPSARVVLCKAVERRPLALTFYTRYSSRKGMEIEANPRAAAVFHWPHAKRQLRMEGPIQQMTSEENDAYFASRPLLSRLAAVASDQSKVLGSRAELLAHVVMAAQAAAKGGPQRPPMWGGYRLVATRVELWVGGLGRLHDRVEWRSSAAETTAGGSGVSWAARRLCP
ncbi:MAG: pyridoxamine 5'-phosphate oxidase [Phycisphaerales bacterium]